MELRAPVTTTREEALFWNATSADTSCQAGQDFKPAWPCVEVRERSRKDSDESTARDQ